MILSSKIGKYLLRVKTLTSERHAKELRSNVIEATANKWASQSAYTNEKQTNKQNITKSNSKKH